MYHKLSSVNKRQRSRSDQIGEHGRLWARGWCHIEVEVTLRTGDPLTTDRTDKVGGHGGR